MTLRQDYAGLQHRLGEDVRAQLVDQFGQVGVIDWRNQVVNLKK
jgi:hypothetical protein